MLDNAWFDTERKFKTYMGMDDLETMRPLIVLPAAGENFGFLDAKRSQENYIAARSAFRDSVGMGMKVDKDKLDGKTVKLDPAKVSDWLKRSAPMTPCSGKKGKKGGRKGKK